MLKKLKSKPLEYEIDEEIDISISKERGIKAPAKVRQRIGKTRYRIGFTPPVSYEDFFGRQHRFGKGFVISEATVSTVPAIDHPDVRAAMRFELLKRLTNNKDN